MTSLYQKSQTISSLRAYFSPYFIGMTRPTAEKVFHLFLAILAVQGIQSIRFLYNWFLKTVSPSSLNSYYHLFSSANIPLPDLHRTTIRIALSCVPEELKTQPVFLIIDDTLQPKFGTHFEEAGLQFDHACHNGSSYLNGHCFVGLVLCVPVGNPEHIRYLRVPVSYRLRAENENKLELAAELIEQSLPAFPPGKQVILLCDSWYPKGAVRKTVAKHPQLELIANVRVDTALYDLPPLPTGKRGRPAKKGARLDCRTDFDRVLQAGDYLVGTRKVMTNLFEGLVYAMVTTGKSESSSSIRLFISTLLPEDILLDHFAPEETDPETSEAERRRLSPYYLYRYRWSIEVVFYEQKTFWSFGQYMIRSKAGIEMYVNLTAIVYSCVQLLPFKQAAYARLKEESSQVKKQLIGTAIQQELFFCTFLSSVENQVNSPVIWNAFNEWNRKKRHF